jgi:chemotaxis protein MotB
LAATLDQERTAKEEEIKRLTRTQEELSKSLQDEISKGNITIQQVRDRLTINMVDRVLFDSGQAQVKPAGVKVLKQVSDILKTVTDKQIRIEGHTDNKPISTKLQDRFKTNWELSTARATTVVRYLIDQGSVDRRHLSAVGYADTQPRASNDSEEGRSSNRRIEIVLYPKDLKEIAGQVGTTTALSK